MDPLFNISGSDVLRARHISRAKNKNRTAEKFGQQQRPAAKMEEREDDEQMRDAETEEPSTVENGEISKSNRLIILIIIPAISETLPH